MVNIFDIILEVYLTRALLIYYFIYSIAFLGGVYNIFPPYSLVNLNCSYKYWFQLLRNDYFYVLMLLTFEIYSLFEPKYFWVPLPHVDG
jgi:hypothetical protein